MNINELQELLIKFRTSLEEYKGIQEIQDEYDIDINDIMSLFPKSCCSYVCKFLGHYLKYDLRIEPIVSYFGIFKIGGHHEWLKYKDNIIDITLDQFDNKLPKIFISSQSDFHENKFSLIKETKGLFEFKHWNKSQIKYYDGLIKSISIK